MKKTLRQRLNGLKKPKKASYGILGSWGSKSLFKKRGYWGTNTQAVTWTGLAGGIRTLFQPRPMILLFLILGGLVIGYTYSDRTNPLFHSPPPPGPDPTNVIYADPALGGVNNSPLPTPWKCNGGNTFLSGTPNQLEMAAPKVANASDVCLSSQDIDLSSANQKLLTMGMFENVVTSALTINFGSRAIWGFYLTTNQTLPSQGNYAGKSCHRNTVFVNDNGYSPYCDPSVQFYLEYDAVQTSCMPGPTFCTLSATLVDFLKNSANQSITMQGLDAGCNNPGGSAYLCTGWTETNAVGPGSPEDYQTSLNYTGLESNVASVSTVTGWFSSGTMSSVKSSVVFPRLNLNQKYFWGIVMYNAVGICGIGFDCHVVAFNAANNPPFNGISSNALSLEAFSFLPSPATIPPPDTGGFFGPLVKAFISLGVWLAANIIGFLVYLGSILGPVLAATFSQLQPFFSGVFSAVANAVIGILNAVGNFFGLGNIGTNLQTLINQFVTLFTQDAGNFFGLVGSYFTQFLNWLSVIYQWVSASAIVTLTTDGLTFLAKGIPFFLSIVGFIFTLVSAGYVTIIIVFYFIYIMDDGPGGVLSFLETMQFLMFNIGWNFVITIVNFLLDIITAIVGIIPKPFLQMVAHKFPRFPTVDSTAHFIFPRFDFAELRSGNMFSILLVLCGFYFFMSYEGTSPALPGSIGTFVVSDWSGFNVALPILQLIIEITALISFTIWPLTKFLTALSIDAGMIEEFTVSPGRTAATGGHVRGFKPGVRRFQRAGPQTKELAETGQVRTIIFQDRRTVRSNEPINITPKKELSE